LKFDETRTEAFSVSLADQLGSPRVQPALLALHPGFSPREIL
jgi:hypothetical protein